MLKHWSVQVMQKDYNREWSGWLDLDKAISICLALNGRVQSFSNLHISESESALFAKCAQTHEEFVVVFKKLLVHTCIHTYIYTYISDMRTEHLNKI